MAMDISINHMIHKAGGLQLHVVCMTLHNHLVHSNIQLTPMSLFDGSMKYELHRQ